MMPPHRLSGSPSHWPEEADAGPAAQEGHARTAFQPSQLNFQQRSRSAAEVPEMDDPAEPAQPSPAAHPADLQPLSSAFPAQSEEEDAQLLLGLAARDEAALAALYDRYSAAVYALLLRLLDHTSAQEVLQDVFLRLWQAPGRFEPARAELRSYLLVMARSRALDRLRQAKNEWRLYDDQGDDFPLPDERQNPFSQAVRAERSELLTRALGSLSEAQQETVRRTFLLGESREETARGMGVPLGTVKSRLNSALGRLRELLAERLDSRPDAHRDGEGDAGIRRIESGNSNEQGRDREGDGA